MTREELLNRLTALVSEAGFSTETASSLACIAFLISAMTLNEEADLAEWISIYAKQRNAQLLEETPQ